MRGRDGEIKGSRFEGEILLSPREERPSRAERKREKRGVKIQGRGSVSHLKTLQSKHTEQPQRHSQSEGFRFCSTRTNGGQTLSFNQRFVAVTQPWRLMGTVVFRAIQQNKGGKDGSLLIRHYS